MANFLAPRGIDLSHYNYVVMDGLYYSFLYIKAGGYPSRVRAGWMSSLINAGEGVDIDVHLRRENRSRTIDKVAQRIRLNRTKLKSMQDTSTDYEELTNSIQAGYFIKNGIANYNEDLFYMSVFITVSAKTYEELLWRKQQMVDMLKSMDMYTSECSFQQEAALQSVMPFLKISPKLEKKAQRNVLTSGAASSYIFTSFELSDDNGVLLGINRYNNSLCIVDLFNTKINKNANLNLLGTSGAGKTFTMQLLALRMRMRGIQCYILAPIKGHEFRRACNKIGGEFIKIAPGSPHCINVMEIRHTMSPEMELIDEIDYVEMGSMLARKIQQLMTFFGLLIPDMSNEEEQMLDEALIRTYADFGITHDNDSIYTDMASAPPKMKQMPILGDLHKHLQENPMTQRLAAIISRFVTGSAQSFNRQTNVDLSNKYIVLDLSELKGKLLPVGMFIALDYVWDQIKADRTKRKAIFIDEIWQLMAARAWAWAAASAFQGYPRLRRSGHFRNAGSVGFLRSGGRQVRQGDHQQLQEQDYSESGAGRGPLCTGNAEAHPHGDPRHHPLRARRGAHQLQQQQSARGGEGLQAGKGNDHHGSRRAGGNPQRTAEGENAFSVECAFRKEYAHAEGGEQHAA